MRFSATAECLHLWWRLSMCAYRKPKGTKAGNKEESDGIAVSLYKQTDKFCKQISPPMSMQECRIM